MENTLENSIKFFALYIGQNVVQTPHLIWSGNPPEPSHEEWSEDSIRIDNISKLCESGFPMFLKPLSSISDEDAKELAKKARPFAKTSHNARGGRHLLKFDENKPIVYDFLHAKGYALPWMGLSVEKQIEYGWIKLIN